MGRGPRGSVVRSARLRRRRPELEIRQRRDRPGCVQAVARGVLRDQDASVRPLRSPSGRCWSRQAASTADPRRRMAGRPRSARCDPFRRRRDHRRADRGLRGRVLATIPAGLVPMATQIRRIGRHGHVVARARRDLAMAAGADVGLDRLVRLHAAHLDRAEAAIPQTHGSAQHDPGEQPDHRDDSRDDEDVVGTLGDELAIRVEAHGPSIVPIWWKPSRSLARQASSRSP
ncbi:MAG: hypothetical protein QOJ74_1681 [Ilumatobacteraceae bacterium]|nr:hypothetical protein [Ilumatobacteraceae bacterium]